ncbi:hypothetical protein [Flavobacterium sp.]|uniref:hypothetical protein n=1 Tax=Flavobacterium sp. TaxID=239 RepID=UPI00375330BB
MNMKEFDLENNEKIASGFKIPEGYFDDFESKMMLKLPNTELKVIPLIAKRKFWFSAIAALFLIAISIGMYLNFSRNELTTNEEYLLAFESSITTDEIAEHLTDEDLNKIEESLNLLDPETAQYAQEYLQ